MHYKSPAPGVTRLFARSRTLGTIGSVQLNRLFLIGSLLALMIAPAFGQANTGSISGRVFNAGSGQYMNNVRITVAGTKFETFTDNSGSYYLANIASGQVSVIASYTGMPSQTLTVEVPAGAAVVQDFKFGAGSASKESGDEMITLDAFTVRANREMEGAVIAINEQRFAPNLKNVLSVDEFGEIPDGNIGEFVKFMPGVNVTSAGGDMRYISLNGAPTQYVPITIAGFDVASAASSGTGRQIELEQISVNNIARIEINQSPTAESPGSALAGSVNLVPRSAFERARPETILSVFMMMRESDTKIKKTPDIKRETAKNRPGFELNSIVPVNKNFGFTISAAYSSQFNPEISLRKAWRGANGATNGTSYPDTTPDKPYLTDAGLGYTSKWTNRRSGAISADYRLSAKDRLSFSLQYSHFEAEWGYLSPTFRVNQVAPGDFSTSFTHGATGAGRVDIEGGGRNKAGATWMPTLVYRHDGDVYRAEVGIGVSRADNHYRDISDGYFTSLTAALRNVTVSFEDTDKGGLPRISVIDPAGNPVDYSDLSNYTLGTVSTNPVDSVDTKKTAYANIQRDFSIRFPLSLKVGVDVREMTRDITRPADAWSLNYIGPAGTPDSFIDPIASQLPLPFGYGKTDWIDAYSYTVYKIQPQLFSVIDQNAVYRNYVSISKWAQETISAGYISADAKFFSNRLRIVAGLRGEQTEVEAKGPLTDLNRNIQRDSSGNVIRDTSGKPLPIKTIPLDVSKLTYLERGAVAERDYLRWFPSVNATFNITDALIFRAAAYTSIGRPNYNQYAGGVTIPDLGAPPSPTANLITVNNVGIEPWKATSSKISLEYYFPNRGAFSVGFTRRDYHNFFGNTIFQATPEFLTQYDLDPNVYGQYWVSTQYNLSTPVRTEIVTVDYRQPLTFLPDWARGVQVFANVTSQRIEGDDNANLSGFTPRTVNWGVSLARPKFSLKANWSYSDRARRNRAAVRSSDPDLYVWLDEQLFIDVSGEYRITENVSVYANLRNIIDTPVETMAFGPSTPEFARLTDYRSYGSVWVFGVRGRF